MYRKLSYKQPALIIIILLFSLFLFAGTSLASTPTITQYSPAPGASYTVNEANISFTVTDPDKILETEYYIKVNGALIAASINYPIGHWEVDSCGGSYWVIDDYTQAVISGRATNLIDGPQIIEVSAKDYLGYQVTYSWGINAQIKPTFSNQSPANGATANGNLPISVKVTDNTKVDPLTIIFKVDGNQVSYTYNSTTGIASYQSPTRLTDGNHSVWVSAKDMSGNEETTTWSFLVSNAPPTIVEYSPANGTILNQGDTPISFKVSDPNGISYSGYSIKVNGILISSTIDYPIGHWDVDECGGTYWAIDDYTQAVISGNVSNLKDGLQLIEISANDNLGNTMTFNWGVTVVINPIFSNQSPADGTTVSQNVPISVKVTDNTKVDPLSIIFKVDGSQVQHTFDSTSGIASYQSPSRLTNGNHTVSVSAKDTSGNQATTEWSFTVLNSVNSGPTLIEYNPASGTILTKGDTSISFKISDPDSIAGSGYYIKVNGVLISSTINYPVGHWEYDSCGYEYWVIDDYTQAVISGNAANLKDGLQLIDVYAKDNLGNAMSFNWGVTVAAGPTYTNQSPASGGGASGLAPISVKVTDNTQVDPLSIVLTLDGNKVSHTYDAGTGVVSYQSPTRLADGTHTVYITAKDINGNSSSYSWSYTVVNTGPTLTFIDEGRTRTTSSPLLKVSASSSQKIISTSASLEIDGKPIITTFNYNTANIYTQGTLSGTGSSLVDGTHTLKATISDSLGNVSTKEWSFKVNLSPSLTTPYPENQSFTKDNSGFTVKASDNDGINSSSIVAKLDNVVVPVDFDVNTGIISYRPNEAIPDGPHTVNISIADTFGNYSDYSWSFIVQITGPNLIYLSSDSFETYKPTLSVYAKSNAKISDTGTIVQIDGQSVDYSFVYKGHQSSTWIVDSYTEATITCNSIPLSDGNHNLSVSVNDILGNSTTKSWTFKIAQKPTINQQTPANETSINTLSTLISAVISDLNDTSIDKASIKMLVDNVDVLPTITDENGKATVSYKAANLKDDAYHTVSVTAADPAGNSSTSSWRFYVNSKGEMSTNSADCGTCHAINTNNKYVHSVPPFGGDCDHCHGSYEPQFCGYCHDDSGTQNPQNCTFCHTNTPNVYSGMSGNQVVMRQVNVTSNPPQLQPGNTLVHDILSKHYINKGDCNNCHSTYLTREHNRVNRNGTQMNCATCHKTTNTTVQQAVLAKNRDCSACHLSAVHEQLHIGNLKIACQSCHNPNIEIEHLQGNATQGKNYTCNTCHASTDVNVIMAIATNSLSCNSCHNNSHGLTLGKTVPVDIPLQTGFTWSEPIDTRFVVGELSMPTGYDSGRYILSNRRNDITSEEIYNYYNDQLYKMGWETLSQPPAIGDRSFTSEYQKGQRHLIVKCGYKEYIPIGYRIELWYK